MRILPVGIIVGFLYCSGCSGQHVARFVDRPVLLHLEGREQIITITSGPDGPRYSVTTRDGRTLFRDMTMAELHATHPGLHDRLKSAIARNEDTRDERYPAQSIDTSTPWQ